MVLSILLTSICSSIKKLHKHQSIWFLIKKMNHLFIPPMQPTLLPTNSKFLEVQRNKKYHLQYENLLIVKNKKTFRRIALTILPKTIYLGGQTEFENGHKQYP